MSNELVETFGRQLIRYGRDEGIESCDLQNSSHCVSVSAERWRVAAVSAGGFVPATMVVADCVDNTIFELLCAMDDDDLLHVTFMTQSGESIDLSVVGCGEPAGWYAGTREWRAWYSKERILDADDLDISAIKAEYGTESMPDEPAPILDDLEMARRAIEELGILLVRHVRDVAIRSCDEQLLPSSNTPTAERWRHYAAQHDGRIPPEILIPDCVDEAILAFLRAIDEGLLPLSFVAENGDIVDLVKDGRGQLAAHYAEWRATYSQQRFVGAEGST